MGAKELKFTERMGVVGLVHGHPGSDTSRVTRVISFDIYQSHAGESLVPVLQVKELSCRKII